MKKFIWALAVLILLGGIASAVYISQFYSPALRIAETYPGDVRLWEELLRVENTEAFESEPLGVIIPHHLIAADKTAQFYANLAATKKDVSTIIILGPNHYESSPEIPVQTCLNCIYESTLGDVEIDKDFVNLMKQNGVAKIVDRSFPQEHAIYAHTPFIKKNFPNAKIVPIITQWKIGQQIDEKLAVWLSENMPQDALVIASVDFSHYIPVNAANFHDESSLATIKNFDFDNIYDLEVDSPDSLYILMKLMELRGAPLAERIFHTNLQDYLQELQKETTSHQYITFSKGKIDRVFGASILSFGNVPADSELGLIDDWADGRESSQYLRDIRGSEDRFLVGSDFLVFDGKENECLPKTQNFMNISFCRFNEGGEFEQQSETLSKATEESDLVYVQYQFSSSILNDERKDQLKSFADLGADIVVGQGITSVEPFENYNGSLIFYSLGDFIPSSQAAFGPNTGTNGLIMGIWATPLSYEIYFFRIVIENGYPKFMDYSQNKEFFGKYFQGVVSESEDTELGTIKIAR